MTFNFLRPGLTVNVEAKVQEQIILDSSDDRHNFSPLYGGDRILLSESGITQSTHSPREMDTREARISASTELHFY